jgi:nucleoside-diphosphate-sugar epimerase
LLIDKVKRGETMSGRGSRILNLIHRDDAVNAMMQVLQQTNPKEGKIYNVSDNEWAKRREIVDWIAGALSLPKVAFDDQESTGAPNRKVSSDRIRKETGWSPFYSSFQKAYQEMLAS